MLIHAAAAAAAARHHLGPHHYLGPDRQADNAVGLLVQQLYTVHTSVRSCALGVREWVLLVAVAVSAATNTTPPFPYTQRITHTDMKDRYVASANVAILTSWVTSCIAVNHGHLVVVARWHCGHGRLQG